MRKKLFTFLCLTPFFWCPLIQATTNLNYLSGVIVPIITPLNKDKQINWDSFQILLNKLMAQNISGIFINSGTGEWSHLDNQERIKALEIGISSFKDNPNNKALLAGVGANSLKEILTLVNWTNQKKAISAIVVPIPVFLEKDSAGKISDKKLVQFYLFIDTISKHPILIYDPKTHFSPTSLSQLLLKSKMVVGMKYNEKKAMEKFGKMVETAKGRIKLLACSETILEEAIHFGASGVIAGAANIYPNAISEYLADLKNHHKSGLKFPLLKAATELESTGHKVLGMKALIHRKVPGVVTLREKVKMNASDLKIPSELRPYLIL